MNDNSIAAAAAAAAAAADEINVVSTSLVTT